LFRRGHSVKQSLGRSPRDGQRQAEVWNIEIMEWIPAVFIAFKVSVLGIGMFLAIKWHYDKAKNEKGPESQRMVLKMAGTVILVFLLALGVLLFLAFGLGSMLGIDLAPPY